MSKLHSSREIVNALVRGGYVVVSQRGSHVKLRLVLDDRTHTVIVQHPTREVPLGTFNSILDQAALTHTEFDRL